MDKDIDSLDNIIAIINSTEEHAECMPLEEPSYEIIPRSQNHATSFGAGGRISQVIDPDFRRPASSTNFGEMLDAVFSGTSVSNSNNTPSNSTNALVVSSNHMDIHPSPPQPHESSANQNSHSSATYGSEQRGQTGMTSNFDPQPAFSLPNNPNSFSDLARKFNNNGPSFQNQMPTTSSNITSNTLLEYGPPVGYTSDHQRHYQQHYQAQQHGQHYPPGPRQQIYLPHPMPPMGPSPVGFESRFHEAPASSYQHYAPHQPSVRRPSTDSRLQKPIDQTPFQPSTSHISKPPNDSGAGRSNGNHVNNNHRTLKDAPIYSPALPPSPPLDKITDSSSSRPHLPATSSGKIPKKFPAANESYDDMDLLTLQKKYRLFEREQEDNTKKRQDIERYLNNLTRNSKGKNVELDPNFREYKQAQKQCSTYEQEIKANLSKISDKLWSKFNHKITPISSTPMLQRLKRAKMSTATPASKDRSKDNSSKDQRLRKLMFELGGSEFWCSTCDEHLDTLADFCDHLHKRDHLNSMKNRPTPWRLTREPIDKKRTYDMMKSICAKLENETNSAFSLTDLDHALNPVLKDKEQVKAIRIDRERGKFHKDDPLFSIKGYNYLIPIAGFYCTLCDQTLCDKTEVDQHIKGHWHNYSHAKSVVQNPQHEINFRNQLNRSYKKQFDVDYLENLVLSVGKPRDSSKNKQLANTTSKATNSSAAPIPSSSSGISPPTGLTQYKKPTSRIVDEHEIIAEKFPERRRQPEPEVPKQQQQNKATESGSSYISDSSKYKKRPASVVSDASDDTIPDSAPPAKISISIPEIVPIGESRSKPSALKRLKTNGVERKTKKQEEEREDQLEHKAKPKPYISSSSSSSSDDDIEILEEVHLDSGDPDSPFPELTLTVTGNIHEKILKDKRLSLNSRVILTRINLEDYKDMLLESTTLWTRVNQMVAKREPGNPSNLDLGSKVTTKPTYFNMEGEDIPVEPDQCDDEAGKDAVSNEDNSKEVENETFHMSLLENFFCNK